jgi:hypothetical protein
MNYKLLTIISFVILALLIAGALLGVPPYGIIILSVVCGIGGGKVYLSFRPSDKNEG